MGFGFLVQKVEAQQGRLLIGQVFAAMSNRSTAGIIVESQKSKATNFTDERGYFSLYVLPHDTIYYYVNKLAKSIPYHTDSIKNWDGYAIAIQTIEYDIAVAKKYGAPVAEADSNVNLGNVTVTARNYHKDSLENRMEYDKIFNYKNPPINPFSPVQTIYDLLSFKKKKRMKKMKNDLLYEEREGYVDTRFNRTIVVKSIGKPIDDSTLDNYMKKYRPTYEDAIGMENIAMVMYIRKTFELYQNSLHADKSPALNPVINKK
ncbi:MAG: hypothetical protein DI598_05785 [Pseudopedobacter saltans]|uniref:Uncharacterized protein n=1 Tax=Pseudopedobacter saltans TaxID=151895 RepID=A0A2W5H3X3_9SPHI|nr:MAG: hypothetical protein DI598_05785 [Pseudopedobacter saltans]